MLRTIFNLQLRVEYKLCIFVSSGEDQSLLKAGVLQQPSSPAAQPYPGFDASVIGPTRMEFWQAICCAR